MRIYISLIFTIITALSAVMEKSYAQTHLGQSNINGKNYVCPGETVTYTIMPYANCENLVNTFNCTGDGKIISTNYNSATIKWNQKYTGFESGEVSVKVSFSASGNCKYYTYKTLSVSELRAKSIGNIELKNADGTPLSDNNMFGNKTYQLTTKVSYNNGSGSNGSDIYWMFYNKSDQLIGYLIGGNIVSFRPDNYYTWLKDYYNQTIFVRAQFVGKCSNQSIYSGDVKQIRLLPNPYTDPETSTTRPTCSSSTDGTFSITSLKQDGVTITKDNFPTEGIYLTVAKTKNTGNEPEGLLFRSFPMTISGLTAGVQYKFVVERAIQGKQSGIKDTNKDTLFTIASGPELTLNTPGFESTCYDDEFRITERISDGTSIVTKNFNFYDNDQLVGSSKANHQFDLSSEGSHELKAILLSSNGTEIAACTTQVVTFINPPKKTLSLGSVKPTCNGGADGKIIIASTTNYNNSTYSGTFRVYPNETSDTPTETIDVTGITLSGYTLPQGFEAGDYYLSFYDGTCESERAFINIANQTNTEIKITQTNSSNITNCYYPNGSISVSASEGNTELSYQLYNSYTNTAASSIQKNASFDITAEGDYYIRVSDGCNTIEDSETRTIAIISPTITGSDTTKQDAPCYHGPATITINNFSYGGQSAADAGLENFTLQFRRPGYSYDITTYTLPFNYAVAGGQDWDVTILHETSGCGNTIDFPAIGQPAQVSLSVLNIDSVRCYNHSNGSIEVVANEGNTNANRIYTISPDPNNIGGLSTTIEGESVIFNNLPTGTYSITVDDGCPDFNTDEETSIVVNNYPEIQANLSSNQMSCHDIEDGEILVSSSGGIGQLSFSLNGSGEIPGTTTDNITYTNAFGGLNDYTAYSVTIKDVNGCDSTYQAGPISNPPPPPVHHQHR